jgi:RluA family pseudouridine synthase
VDKPAGLPSRPAPGYEASALSFLEAWLDAIPLAPPGSHPEAGRPRRPGVVHRLDRETSGVLLFSLGSRSHRVLVQAFAERRILKDYTAIVAGWPRPLRGTIDLPLRRNASGRTVRDPRGAGARTRYETVRRLEGAALLAVHPVTGRTHQIRAHLSLIGHPVLGDRVYGRGPAPMPGAPRLCLHASRLVLPPGVLEALGPVWLVPRDQRPQPLAVPVDPPGAPPQIEDGIRIEAPLPEELGDLVRRLARSRYGAPG